MIKSIYSIKDLQTDEFAQPFLMKNDTLAMRGFAQGVNNPEVEWNKYPEDYVLFNIGELDTETGIIKQTEAHPKAIISATKVKEIKNEVSHS